MNKRRQMLSELEGVCLGLIRLHQPCSAYRVRRKLKEAPSSHWRASAGSVYPLLARLESEGLVDATSDKRDGRGTQQLRISSAGVTALRSWILAGTDPDLVSSVSDPIRSRSFFLDALNKAEQLSYVDDLIQVTKQYLAETNDRLELAQDSGDQYDYLGALGATMLTETRLSWLRTIKSHLNRE